MLVFLGNTVHIFHHFNNQTTNRLVEKKVDRLLMQILVSCSPNLLSVSFENPERCLDHRVKMILINNISMVLR